VSEPERDGPERLERCRRLIVDGMNALGSRPDGWWRNRPRAMGRLVAQLRELASVRPDLRVEVVFDGRPHERVRVAGGDAVDVSFAGGGRDAADREIAARVRAAASPEATCVVSSDRRLAAAVKAAGGSCLGAGAFRRRWLDPAGAPDADPR
jgi:hypothetical protein